MINIAVDGPAGAGKSYLARQIAKRLSYIYVDTGALYRSVALYMDRKNVDVKDTALVISSLDGLSVSLDYADDGEQHVFLNGEDVSREIRQPHISMGASAVSAIPEVRSFLLGIQKDMASTHNVVMDGRDIGTTVFPQAELKIFMTADPMVRAQRRAAEMEAKGDKVDIQDVLKNLQERDYIDSHREVSPLTQAEDAVVLDNSHMTMDEQLVWIKKIIAERFGC